MGIRVYNLIFYVILPLVLLRLLLRGIRNRAYWRRWHERLGFSIKVDNRPCIWVHAVSVGEVRAAAPLVNRLQQEYPEHIIYITTMTPTGSEQVRQLHGNQVLHSYVPYDLPGIVKRFIQRTRPQILIIMETELWPNLFRSSHIQGIPIVLVNVRLSEKSVHGYKKFKGLVGQTLSYVSKMGLQSSLDVARMRSIGAPERVIELTGNIKFDFDLSPTLPDSAQAMRQSWGAQRKVLVAGSTHEGEDEKVLQAYTRLREKYHDLLLILVPRHPERFQSVARLCRQSNYHVALRSESQHELDASIDILLGDTMGELTLFYAAGDVAYVGGSLVPVGGHNLLEPAALGKPVIFGPHMKNFIEISEKTLEYGAGMQVSDVADFVNAVDTYFSDDKKCQQTGENGIRMMTDNRGALDKTMAMIRQQIKQ